MKVTLTGQLMKRLRVAIAPAVFAIGAASLHADPSLAPRDQFTASTTVDGVPQVLTLLRDHEDVNKFYYIPSVPRIPLIKDVRDPVNGVPEFTLLKYQMQDPQGLKEGGVLQFSITLALPEDSMPALRKDLASQLNPRAEMMVAEAERWLAAKEAELEAAQAAKDQNEPQVKKQIESAKAWKEYAQKCLDHAKLDASGANIVVTPVPLSDAKVTFYSPDGDFITSGSKPSGLAPSYMSQKMPYSVTLNRMGVGILDKLVTGPTGLAVVYELSHVAMTAPASFKVSVDFTNTQNVSKFAQNYSSDESWQFLWWGKNEKHNVRTESLYQSLVSTGVIKEEMVLDPTVIGDDAILEIKNNLLTQIYSQVFGKDQSVAPLKIDPKDPDPAKAEATNNGPRAIQVNTSYFNSINESRKKFDVDFSFRKRITKKTTFGGFVGIGNWIGVLDAKNKKQGDSSNVASAADSTEMSQGLKNQLQQWGIFAYAEDKGFESISFAPPTLAVPNDWGLGSVDLTIEMLQTMDGKSIPFQVGSQSKWLMKWVPDRQQPVQGVTNGTWVRGNNPVNSFILPLGAIAQRKDLSTLRLRTQATLTLKGRSFTLPPDEVPVTSGEGRFASPLAALNVVELDTSGIEFKNASDYLSAVLSYSGWDNTKQSFSKAEKINLRWVKSPNKSSAGQFEWNSTANVLLIANPASELSFDLNLGLKAGEKPVESRPFPKLDKSFVDLAELLNSVSQ